MIDRYYIAQVELLLKVMPHVMKENKLALKGGSAINFFFREVPRLSVDIDLTYVPIEPRNIFLNNMDICMNNISQRIVSFIPGVGIHQKRSKISGGISGLIIEDANAKIKIEPNMIFRGTVYGCEKREISVSITQKTGIDVFMEVNCISFADLYAGKICAALDRQHPRDLFDIMLLMENEGFTEEIRKALVIYLASHNRPMHELLQPSRKVLQDKLNSEFTGMTDRMVTASQIEQTRDDLIRKINESLSYDERLFLISIKQGEPEWGLVGREGINRLPGLQWKLANLKKMAAVKREQQLNKLKAVLGL